MKNVSVIDNNIDTLNTIQGMLTHLQYITITGNTVQSAWNSDIVICHYSFAKTLLGITCPVITYGDYLQGQLPNNFFVLEPPASLFEIQLLVNKLIEPIIASIKPLNKPSTTVNKLPDKSFALALHNKHIEYIYAFVEYLYTNSWIDDHMRLRLYMIVNEIIEVENNLITNIRNITFTHRNGSCYLYADYINPPTQNPFMLYTLGCSFKDIMYL